MPDLTFIVPIGPAHVTLADRAIASAQAQTVPCEIMSMLDAERRGPGVLRNMMLAKVVTEFVTFLDADDWIEPTFAADTIAEYRRIGGDKYIFTNWIDDQNRIVEAPCAANGMDGNPISKPGAAPYCGGTWHVITTLLPTAWGREVGGFDETLPAVEDTDFYEKLCVARRCAHHLAKPLFHYSSGGGRGKSFRESAERDRVMTLLMQRYGGQMGCCGQNGNGHIVVPVGAKLEGDVLAMAQWRGNRQEHGRVSGRHYPRISFPRTAWVDPRDVAQSPQFWRIVEVQAIPKVDEPQGITNLAQMAAFGNAAIRIMQPVDYSAPVNEPPTPAVTSKPDVARVLRLAGRATENTGDPVFVFPEKDYPSYADIKRLARLSGFEVQEGWKINAFSRQPYIVVSPEPIPDLNGIRARVVCWQLEYAGDYTHNYDKFRGEVWASDKAWADTHGAKYVLMGSHPLLAGGHADPGAQSVYDVTMLGYMTPRRGAIKKALEKLRWPEDYPGHDSERMKVLLYTRLMLHVHQHDNAPFLAPQRMAIAAAYRMSVVSETTPGAGELATYITFADYQDIAPTVHNRLAELPLVGDLASGEKLHELLCIERPFRRCIEEALKA